jgi:hypothetical protein
MADYYLLVVRDITDDLPSGEPWPPDGRDLWSIVSRANDLTTWRRLVLAKKTISIASLREEKA